MKFQVMYTFDVYLFFMIGFSEIQFSLYLKKENLYSEFPSMVRKTVNDTHKQSVRIYLFFSEKQFIAGVSQSHEKMSFLIEKKNHLDTSQASLKTSEATK